jgi:hypothetical protein
MSQPRRITDRYAPGERIEITFAGDAHERWWAGVVLRPEPPGLWVQLDDGRAFWVTNSRRIRPKSTP